MPFVPGQSVIAMVICLADLRGIPKSHTCHCLGCFVLIPLDVPEWLAPVHLQTSPCWPNPLHHQVQESKFQTGSFRLIGKYTLDVSRLVLTVKGSVTTAVSPSLAVNCGSCSSRPSSSSSIVFCCH